jgi:pimeloyl-ACP methyl ester carboxylesterase
MQSLGLFLIGILCLSCLSTGIFKQQNHTIAQQYSPTIKHRNLVLDFGQDIRTNAQLTYPAIGNGSSFPAVLLITGSGAEDMNETAGFIRIDNKTGEKIYPPVPFYQIAEYLSERGFSVLRYDKRGVGTNHTIVDANVWGNLTIHDLVQDADKALTILMRQPEVDPNRITVLGHSEGTVITPRVAIDSPGKVDNVVLMGVVDNQTKIFEFQTVGLPIQYAEDVLDKNHDGTISVQEASDDLTFERIIGGNLSLILTQYLQNGTKAPNSEYDFNNDTRINIQTELKPALIENSKLFFEASRSLALGKTTATNGTCINLEGCPAYSSSFLNFTPDVITIGNVPTNTSILILNGDNDTQTPVQGALLLKQKLTQLKHPDHSIITFSNLGHEFDPSSPWFTQHGPIPEYVLEDLFSWLEPRSQLTDSGISSIASPLPSSLPKS